MKESSVNKIKLMVGYCSVSLFLIFALFPFVWVIMTSFKPRFEIFSSPPTWLPKAFTLGHYFKVLFETNIPHYFLNSLIVSSAATCLVIILAVNAAYGFARFRFKGKEFFFLSVLFSQMLPHAVILIPLYVFMRTFKLLDTYAGLTLSYLVVTLPLSTWMLRGFFENIPQELEDAAMIDGCSRLGALIRIILPVSAPAIVAVAAYAFIVSWQEFLFALNFTLSKSTRTLPIGIAEFAGQYEIDWGATAASATIVSIPVVIIFLSFHKYFVKGLTAGAMKG